MTVATKAPPGRKPGSPTQTDGRTQEPYLPAPIEEVNAAISAVWETTGTWKKLSQVVNNPLIKEQMLRVCNMQEMPLMGVDIIPTQQGLKLYINGEGAKFNRERYLAKSGRRIVSRKVVVLPYEEVPYANPERDKNQNRVYFKIVTTVEDTDAKEKIVDAVAKGTIPASQVKDVLEQLGIVQTYETRSSYSNQSEKYDSNRQPDTILKKGITQCHRRADLEISSQCVLPEDEEPKDADFVVRSVEILDQAKAGASLPEIAAPTPATVVEQPEGSPQQSGAETKTGSGNEGDKAALDAKIKKINAIFSGLKYNKAQKVKFFTERGWPVKPSQLTHEIMDKAIEEAKKLSAEGGEKKAEAKKADAPSDPDRNKRIAKFFASREDAGFTDDDEARAWVKKTFSKGLSDMSMDEVSVVLNRTQEFVEFLDNFQKWGFSSKKELATNVVDFGGKPLHEMSPEEIKKVSSDLTEMM